MGYILQMSDFHFGKNPDMEKKRIEDLAKFILNNQIEISFLVFTGDMIDAPTVQAKCVQKLKRKTSRLFKGIKPTDDQAKVLTHVRAAGEEYMNIYDELLRKETLEAMEQAVNIFSDFIQRIKLNNRQVVLCCGNHDRLRFSKEADFDCGHDHHVDEKTMSLSFEAYDMLCGRINNELSHQTMVYSHGGVNFVIANSNWKIPQGRATNSMCVNCRELSTKMVQLNESAGFDRQCTFLVAHKPFDDFCETAKYPYSDESLTISQIVERTAGAFLYGDKHSYSVKTQNKLKEFMCGMPLSSCEVRYNLLDFDKKDGVRACNYILYDREKWIMVPIDDCIEEIYLLSKPYLKKYAFNLLSGNSTGPDNWDSTISLIHSVYENGTLCTISNLFSSLSDLRGDEGALEIIEDNFFGQFVSLIENSTLQSISVKGRPGVGKSTFVTIVYLYLLWQFCRGKTHYIPCYFNLETIIVQLRDTATVCSSVEQYVSYCYKEFECFFEKCCNLSNKYNLPLCLFIDGLEKSKVLSLCNDTLEKRIYQLVETKLKRDRDRYVMCFNTHDSYHFDFSFDKINRFKYVVFMNEVRILPYKEKERKLDMFLSSYLGLRKISIDNMTLQKIKKIWPSSTSHLLICPSFGTAMNKYLPLNRRQPYGMS